MVCCRHEQSVALLDSNSSEDLLRDGDAKAVTYLDYFDFELDRQSCYWIAKGYT